MKIGKVAIRNFRRLENVEIDIEEKESIFVGPNNSGKTSATAVFRCFLDGRDFRFHDLSVARLSDLNTFGADGNEEPIPAIELDIWFDIDPNKIEFGRAFSLLPRLSDEFDKLGVRLKYAVTDKAKLRADYLNAYPEGENLETRKTLSQYLSIDQNFRRHFERSYFSLEDIDGGIVESPLDGKEGKNLLENLVKVDFVDAQRNINDDETNRSNRLSSAFAAFYRKNLEQAEVAAAAHAVIDDNNASLTAHYEGQFQDLMGMIKDFGVPSINDRDLRIISSLSPETALRGSTELLYVDNDRKHELPELYNGLGFKNLIYMAIQVRHFHMQWMRTATNRPLCQMIFIEEPEVHLHAQVQQTFISNIWEIIAKSAKDVGDESLVPQLVVSTHSSHILDAVDFAKVRYFRRCLLAREDPLEAGILNASAVHSLTAFQPKKIEIADDEKVITEAEALAFLQRYLRLTHCDLFFADAVILVEGAVEKLLLPSMIEKTANRLSTSYLTILEIGGAYAHRFEGLLEFLHIPYLVITDLDSVSPDGHHATCRGDSEGALTSNATLKQFFGAKTVENLMAIQSDEKINSEKDRCVSYQIDIAVTDNELEMPMRARTLEEAMCFQNFGKLRDDSWNIGKPIPVELSEAYNVIYERIGSSSFKKTDFAMQVLAGADDWIVPNYIADGLAWLQQRLHPEK